MEDVDGSATPGVPGIPGMISSSVRTGDDLLNVTLDNDIFM